MLDLYSLSLDDITPPNIAHDEQISSLIQAIDPQLNSLSHDALEALILSRIDELPEHIVDLLAWQFHVDFYDLAGTLTMKREAVKGSILWHMHKGTEWAIIEALRMIDIKATFVPWWEDNSEPYTFKLKAIIAGDFYRTKGRDQLVASIRRAVNEAKSARSYMAGLETIIHFDDTLPVFQSIIPFLSGSKRILLPKVEAPGKTFVYSGLASHLQGERVIKYFHERKITNIINYSPIMVKYIDYSLGVDYDTLQELLRQFERRIFERIDGYELRTLETLKANHEETNLKLEQIKDMLRWQEDGDIE